MFIGSGKIYTLTCAANDSYQVVKCAEMIYRVLIVVDAFHLSTSSWEARWPNGYRVGFRMERPGFEPWPGSLCCVLWQDTLLSYLAMG